MVFVDTWTLPIYMTCVLTNHLYGPLRMILIIIIIIIIITTAITIICLQGGCAWT